MRHLRKTAWGVGHRRRDALVEGAQLLASAEQHDLCGKIDQQGLRICGIGAVWSDPAHGSADHARVLVDRLVDDATRSGADIAIVFAPPGFVTAART